jgi:hypothetical protein
MVFKGDCFLLKKENIINFNCTKPFMKKTRLKKIKKRPTPRTADLTKIFVSLKLKRSAQEMKDEAREGWDDD